MPKADPRYRAGQTNENGRIICGAKKKNNDPCGASPKKGHTRCARHGGNSPRSRTAATRRNTTNNAATALAALGHDPNAEPIDPAQALLRLVTDKHLEVQWLRHMVQQIRAGANVDEDPMSSPLVWGVTTHQAGVGPMGPVDVETKGYDLNVWVRWLHTAERDLARYASEALKAGVQERQLQIQETLALQLVGAIHQILNGLNLTPAQQDTAGTLVPQVLRALDMKENAP